VRLARARTRTRAQHLFARPPHRATPPHHAQPRHAGIFAVELLALVAILKLDFFRNLFYAIDLFVVAVAITVDITLHANHSTLQEVASLVVVARCWRFVRIGHGLATTVHEADEHEHGELERHIAELEKQVKKLRLKTAIQAANAKSNV
jgi:hypothetical protein